MQGDHFLVFPGGNVKVVKLAHIRNEGNPPSVETLDPFKKVGGDSGRKMTVDS